MANPRLLDPVAISPWSIDKSDLEWSAWCCFRLLYSISCQHVLDKWYQFTSQYVSHVCISPLQNTLRWKKQVLPETICSFHPVVTASSWLWPHGLMALWPYGKWDFPPRPHCPAVGKWSGPPRCNLDSAVQAWKHDGSRAIEQYKYSLEILRSLGRTSQFQTFETSWWSPHRNLYNIQI